MMEINWRPSKKQYLAYQYLTDNITTELFYGGAAGGGKTHLGCVWLIISCLKYPGSRWLMGRAVLKNLKSSTLLTFFSICSEWNLKKDEFYRYNAIEGVIKFNNGSEIYLKDLFAYPSDPEFDSLGSTEYTGAFIDECSQVSLKAKNIVTSRIRFKLEEFGLIPKTLMTSNPSKNFLYYDFYKPSKEGYLVEYRKFLPALVQDNPFISPHYIENLKKLDKVSKERLLYGNFEYDDDPARLMEYDKIIGIFNNFPQKTDRKYLSVDVARQGEDKTVFMIWEGFHIKEIIYWNKNTTKEVREKIEDICIKENIGKDCVVIDEDGVGGGVCDELDGVNGFINNSRQLDPKLRYDAEYNYKNLKTQCYFALAKYINESRISCYQNIRIDVKEMIVEELEQVKRANVDQDENKLKLVSKKEIKELIGRSPDFSDAMMMRMYFEVQNQEVEFYFV